MTISTTHLFPPNTLVVVEADPVVFMIDLNDFLRVANQHAFLVWEHERYHLVHHDI